MLQGFNWESCNSHKKWFNVVADEAREIADAGFTAVWLPSPTDSVSDQGYFALDLCNRTASTATWTTCEDVAAMKAQGVPGGGHRDQPPVRRRRRTSGR